MLCVECFAHFVDIFWVDHFCLNVLTRILTGNASILQIREEIYRMKPKLRQQQYKKKSERKKCSNGYSLIFEMKWFAVVIRFFFFVIWKGEGGEKKKKLGIDWRTLIRFWNKIMFVFFCCVKRKFSRQKKKNIRRMIGMSRDVSNRFPLENITTLPTQKLFKSENFLLCSFHSEETVHKHQTKSWLSIKFV